MTDSTDLVEHYQKYFRVIKANTPKLITQGYQLRYEVFVSECGYELGDYNHVEHTETDQYDNRALHTLLIHQPSNEPIGYIRLIPFIDSKSGYLPIENYGKDALDEKLISVEQLRSPKTGEISRMSIVSSFRRRAYDVGILGSDLYPENDNDKRRFKINYIPMCLVLSSISLALESGMDSSVATIERPLAVLLRHFGVQYKKIGGNIEYHGIRAPYMFYAQETLNNLSPDFLRLFDVIQYELNFGQN